ncbi:NAD(P)H-hydrate dehydratase [Candidatus Woesearchaeota archaeon]|nr:NAD(P)H-hydrate dehydratase [Candidatus Woesearchaeota archaeon]
MKYITYSDIRLKKRRSGSHKGENGRVLAVGGSMEYAGAIMLAGMAAYRSGVDTVVIAAPEKIALAINAWPDFITVKLRGSRLAKEHARQVINLSSRFDCMVLGNGVGLDRETQEFCCRVIKGSMCRMVIDADALKAIRIQDAKNSILTPHKREYEMLLRNSRLAGSNVQKHLGSNVLLLKGKVDVIQNRNSTLYNRTGNAGMTVSGTGDVLAGLCAGLVAQGNSLLTSAAAAAYINGYAGDLLYREFGYGFTATDLADKIAYALKRWL